MESDLKIIYLMPPTSGVMPLLTSDPRFGGITSVRARDAAGRLALLHHWAFDNDCFSGNGFKATKYLNHLRYRLPVQKTCLFAVAPDVLGDAKATWERSKDMLPQIRALGYNAALVAQDGWDSDAVDWDAFDCLFIGGTTEFKLSDRVIEIAYLAKYYGKWLHMGRVNSRRRLIYADSIGCKSADGTFPVFAPKENIPRMKMWYGDIDG